MQVLQRPHVIKRRTQSPNVDSTCKPAWLVTGGHGHRNHRKPNIPPTFTFAQQFERVTAVP